MVSIRRKYNRRDTFSVHINIDTDDKTLEWINNQKHLSGAILNVLKKYANNELLHIDTVKQMLNSNIEKKAQILVKKYKI